jgi:hypothetical protein
MEKVIYFLVENFRWFLYPISIIGLISWFFYAFVKTKQTDEIYYNGLKHRRTERAKENARLKAEEDYKASIYFKRRD